MIALLVLLATMAASCDRRDLYVSGEGYQSLELNVDWTDYGETPGGMTTWFFPLDKGNPTTDPEQMTNNDHKPYQNTTANVTKESLYLPSSRYQGVVIDYSPAEYGHQEFRDMDNIHEARVVMADGTTQADNFTLPGKFISVTDQTAAREKLFGESAIVKSAQQKPVQAASNYYLVNDQPEPIAADTLHNRQLTSGSAYGDYIPYKERDTFQKDITVQKISSKPHSLVWTATIRVFIEKGYQNMWQVRGSLCGLANGHYLARHVNTDLASIILLDEWQRDYGAGDSGWITTTVTCFGLCPTSVDESTAEYHPSEHSGKSISDGRLCDIDAYHSKVCLKNGMRLNLVFVLRDQKTTESRNYGIGQTVITYDDQLVMEMKLDKDFYKDGIDNPIVLPDVTPYEDSAAGFGADVTPWQDGGTAEETM